MSKLIHFLIKQSKRNVLYVLFKNFLKLQSFTIVIPVEIAMFALYALYAHYTQYTHNAQNGQFAPYAQYA